MTTDNTRLSGVPELLHLRNSQGLAYSEFRRRLGIRRSVILVNFAVAWAMIGFGLAALSLVPTRSYWILLAAPAALWLSFWLQAYTIHFHEAAHYNIHPDRKINDLISDIFITPFVGMWVRQYRVSHWRHHLHLGGLEDTETSYRNAIGWRQIAEVFTGLYLLKTAGRYLVNFSKGGAGGRAVAAAGERSSARLFFLSLAIMLTLQFTAMFLLNRYVSFAASLAWGLNIFVFFPFIYNLRQTLEHRSFDARPEVDYSKVEHGPVNRMFGTDFLSRSFGGAGFNRHLLHHYDPAVSYTAFDELEAFFMDSEIAARIESSRTSYPEALGILLRQ